jgi:hypothetical protein
MMGFFRKTAAKIVNDRPAEDLAPQVALLKDQLMAAQEMLEAEVRARIALEERLMQRPPRS